MQPANFKQELENDWPVIFQFCLKFDGVRATAWHPKLYQTIWEKLRDTMLKWMPAPLPPTAPPSFYIFKIPNGV